MPNARMLVPSADDWLWDAQCTMCAQYPVEGAQCWDAQYPVCVPGTGMPGDGNWYQDACAQCGCPVPGCPLLYKGA